MLKKIKKRTMTKPKGITFEIPFIVSVSITQRFSAGSTELEHPVWCLTDVVSSISLLSLQLNGIKIKNNNEIELSSNFDCFSHEKK